MNQPLQKNTRADQKKIPIPPGLPLSGISRIQKSFRLLSSQGDQIVCRFNDVLFERFPELRSFFPFGRKRSQRTRFLNGLHTLIRHLDHPPELRATLIQLGVRHRRYGIDSRYYHPVLETFLQVLTEFGGTHIDGKTYEAWENFLHVIRAIMLETPCIDGPAYHRNGQPPDTNITNHTKRILLIDDDHQLLTLYHSYLESQGYLCSRVSNVAWAFAHLQMSHYDLVLTDFQMPEMNGIQIRKTLDSLDNTHCPPFVLITGSLSPEIQRQAFESGFLGVLKKPHDLHELSSIVQMALTKSLRQHALPKHPLRAIASTVE
jgi:CheY-like chemotaxis protein